MKMTRTEIKEKEMMMANGGRYVFDTWEEECCYYNNVHYGCGGHISGDWDLFTSCKCDKCGETHYFYNSFFKFDIEDDC